MSETVLSTTVSPRHDVQMEAATPEQTPVQTERLTVDEDIAMREAEDEPATTSENAAPEMPGSVTQVGSAEAEKQERKTDRKEEKKDLNLEDLFADVDSDDEFPSSREVDDMLVSSPPDAAVQDG